MKPLKSLLRLRETNRRKRAKRYVEIALILEFSLKKDIPTGNSRIKVGKGLLTNSLTATRSMINFKPLLSFNLHLLAVLLLFSGCGLIGLNKTQEQVSKKETEAAHELGNASSQWQGPIHEQLVDAKDLYEKRLFALAAESFRKLRDSYNRNSLEFGNSYREFAQLKLADSLFFGQDFGGAIREYEQFINEFPKSTNLAYAILQVGHSNQHLSPGIGRDRTYLERSVAAFEQVWKKHPNSRYARVALEHFEQCQNQLKKHHEMVRSYYENQTLPHAARARLKAERLTEKQIDHELKFSQGLLKNSPSLEPISEIQIKK